jgi:hypothetical protein
MVIGNRHLCAAKLTASLAELYPDQATSARVGLSASAKPEST